MLTLLSGNDSLHLRQHLNIHLGRVELGCGLCFGVWVDGAAAARAEVEEERFSVLEMR